MLWSLASLSLFGSYYCVFFLEFVLKGAVSETSKSNVIETVIVDEQEISEADRGALKITAIVQKLGEPTSDEINNNLHLDKDLENRINDIERRLSNYIMEFVESDFLDIETQDVRSCWFVSCYVSVF